MNLEIYAEIRITSKRLMERNRFNISLKIPYVSLEKIALFKMLLIVIKDIFCQRCSCQPGRS